MMLKVANDDAVSFRNNNQWLVHPPSKALIFSDLEAVWGKLKPAFNLDFANLVYGVLPKEGEILQSLDLIRKKLKPMVWTIEFE